MTSSFEGMLDNTGNITGTIGGLDETIKEAFNSSQFVEVINDIKIAAISSAETAGLGVIADNITQIADFVFDIYEVSKNIKV